MLDTVHHFPIRFPNARSLFKGHLGLEDALNALLQSMLLSFQAVCYGNEELEAVVKCTYQTDKAPVHMTPEEVKQLHRIVVIFAPRKNFTWMNINLYILW